MPDVQRSRNKLMVIAVFRAVLRCAHHSHRQKRHEIANATNPCYAARPWKPRNVASIVVLLADEVNPSIARYCIQMLLPPDDGLVMMKPPAPAFCDGDATVSSY